MRNKGIFKHNAPNIKQQSGQKDGTYDKRTSASTPQVLHPRKPAPVDTTTATTKEDESSTTKAPKVKYIFVFAPCCLRKSRENTNASKKKFTFAHFCPDCLKICHDESRKGSRKGGGKRTPFAVWRAYEKGHPPPIWGAPRAFSPHNFSRQKYRKKSPWSDWKKFRKKFVGKCFGGRESPQSCRKGARR